MDQFATENMPVTLSNIKNKFVCVKGLYRLTKLFKMNKIDLVNKFLTPTERFFFCLFERILN